MSKAVVFLLASLAILMVYACATGNTVLDHDIPRGAVGNLAFLGSLGLLHRSRRLRHNQAI